MYALCVARTTQIRLPTAFFIWSDSVRGSTSLILEHLQNLEIKISEIFVIWKHLKIFLSYGMVRNLKISGVSLEIFSPFCIQ
jgi:hypothetical protein